MRCGWCCPATRLNFVVTQQSPGVLSRHLAFPLSCWQPHPLLVVIAVAALLMHISGRWCGTWSAIVATALLAYAAGAMESSNLLDYLADPGLLIALAVMGALPRTRRVGSATQGHSANG